MRPYGWKRWEWRDEEHAPCTRYVGHGIRSPQRKQRRRKLHQRARRAAKSEISRELLIDLIGREEEEEFQRLVIELEEACFEFDCRG